MPSPRQLRLGQDVLHGSVVISKTGLRAKSKRGNHNEQQKKCSGKAFRAGVLQKLLS